MSSISKGAKELALKIEREEGGDPRTEEQRKPRGKEYRNENQTLIILPSPMV